MLDDIEQFKSAEDVIEERSDEDTYIVTLLKGLDNLTDKQLQRLMVLPPSSGNCLWILTRA
jgi:hypothetical protein